MNINNVIQVYADFLNKSWNVIQPLLKDRDYTSFEETCNDWLQCCWEMLVERKVLSLNHYLDIYGEGADFYGTSSRITDINEVPTHVVKIKSTNSNEVFDLLNETYIDINNLNFEKLVGFKNGYYSLSTPFDYVLLSDSQNQQFVVALSDLGFYLTEVK